MAIQSLNNLTEDWYTPEGEKEKDNPTRFKLKPLDGRQYMAVMLETKQGGGGDFSLSASGMNIALDAGLVGWENFDVPFSKANFGKIPALTLISIASEIISRSTMDGEQGKNS